MPTYDSEGRFRRDWARLDKNQQKIFLEAIDRLVDDLAEMEAGRRSRCRRGLGVKGVKGHPGVFEMRWAPDGRATFSWGEERRPGQRHVTWRRCGDHETPQGSLIACRPD